MDRQRLFSRLAVQGGHISKVNQRIEPIGLGLGWCSAGFAFVLKLSNQPVWLGRVNSDVLFERMAAISFTSFMMAQFPCRNSTNSTGRHITSESS